MPPSDPDGPGDTSEPPDRSHPPRWSEVSAGGLHACAILEGDLWCWGRNDRGQSHDNGGSDLPAAARISAPRSNATWDAVAAGGEHTCAISAGELWCWGANESGQLGDGTRDDRATPALVEPPTGTALPWFAVSAGGSHTCAVISATMFCFGNNSYRQLGDGTKDDRLVPTPVAGPADEGAPAADPLVAAPWTAVSAGAYHTCGIRGGEVWCWGYNLAGQIGDGSHVSRAVPTRVIVAGEGEAGAAPADDEDPNGSWDIVAAGGYHTCAQRQDGLWCWGQNLVGQLGLGGGGNRNTPARVPEGLIWTALSAGFHHTCGVADGELWCWGRNTHGRLGDGTDANLNLPTRTGLLAEPAALDAGTLDAGALDAGSPANAPAASSAPVADAPVWAAVAAGDYHTCAIVDGGLRCAGFNDYGSLGDGTRRERRWFAPVAWAPRASPRDGDSGHAR